MTVTRHWTLVRPGQPDEPVAQYEDGTEMSIRVGIPGTEWEYPVRGEYRYNDDDLDLPSEEVIGTHGPFGRDTARAYLLTRFATNLDQPYRFTQRATSLDHAHLRPAGKPTTAVLEAQR